VKFQIAWGCEAYCYCLALQGGVGGTSADGVLKSQY